MPVIRWNLVPKVLSLTLSRLAPEPPVTVAVLCFYASPATASHVAVGGLGFRQRWRVPRSPGATQPAAPCLVPAAVAVASGPAQPAEASVRPAVRSRWTARERKGKRIGPACSDGFLRFLFYPSPPPFCMPSRPLDLLRTEPASCEHGPAPTSPDPGNPATTVSSRTSWGGDGPRAALLRSGQSYVQPRHSPSHRPPTPRSVRGGFPQPGRSCLLSRPWPPGHTLLEQAHCQPQSGHQHPPGPRTTGSHVRDPGCGLLGDPGRPGRGASRGPRPVDVSADARFAPSALSPQHLPGRPRGACSGPWVEPGRPSLPVCPARPSGPRCHPPRPVITRQPPRRADAVGLGSLPRTRGHRGRPAAPAWAGSWGVPAGPLCQQQCLRLPGGLRGRPVPCVL